MTGAVHEPFTLIVTVRVAVSPQLFVRFAQYCVVAVSGPTVIVGPVPAWFCLVGAAALYQRTVTPSPTKPTLSVALAPLWMVWFAGCCVITALQGVTVSSDVTALLPQALRTRAQYEA